MLHNEPFTDDAFLEGQEEKEEAGSDIVAPVPAADSQRVVVGQLSTLLQASSFSSCPAMRASSVKGSSGS